ncbi:hypothetical protein TL16_g09261 [Triparma laevis f. inornata]|uniref:Uncharacterized protein n=1 Tax=Triparma laevis f. inornata TaxID=1714386 RepID=A0A9W7B241_9STRA|nr:hypothetical protein TL16_g09261 [Triparma laevis f. inornata]
MSENQGGEDEGNENEEVILNVPPAESLIISTTVFTVPASTDQFMYTPEFRRHFVEFVPGDTLMTLRLVTKGWKAAADGFIDEGVRSGAIIVHDGKGKGCDDSNNARKERHTLVTRVIFLLNVTNIGKWACYKAANLVIVDIVEGAMSIGEYAFRSCSSLTTVSFPTTLTSIGGCVFEGCSSLDNVDLLHTNVQELGGWSFQGCSELKSMTIPDSLQTLGHLVFHNCSKLVPSNINVDNYFNDTTSEVVAHLRAQQH